MGHREDQTLDCAHSTIPGIYEDWTRLLWNEMQIIEEELKLYKYIVILLDDHVAWN